MSARISIRVGKRLRTAGSGRAPAPNSRPVADHRQPVAEGPDRLGPTVRDPYLVGPERLGVLAEPPAIQPDDFARLSRRDDTLVVDCRSPQAFTAYIPGALNVAAGTAFSTWAGTVLPENARILLVLEQPGDLEDIKWQLLRIGYNLPEAWLAGGMLAWRTSGRDIEILPQWTVHELRQALAQDRDLTILDVRQPAEWSEGHITGARHISGGELPKRLDEIPDKRPLAVICGSGYRSSVMASLLQRHRRGPVFNVLGGMTGWQSAGYATEAA